MVYQCSDGAGGGDRSFANFATASAEGVLLSCTNSETLPAMLSAPHGLAPAGRELARCTALVPTFARAASGSLPHGKIRPSTPRAAFSHSRSLGRRRCAHCA